MLFDIIGIILDNPLVKWVENTLGLESPWSAVALYGAIVLVIVVLILIICGAANSQDKEYEGINLYDESIPFTVEDFKEFLVNSYEKYPEQLDIIIPTSWDVSNYQDNELNLEEIVKIIDKAVSDRNWSLSDGCLAFRIIDRTM